MDWSSILGNVGSAVKSAGGIFGTLSGLHDMFTESEARKQQQYNYENQYSIAAKDMENAGLSKTLAAGASAGSYTPITGSHDIGAGLRDAGTSLAERAQWKAEFEHKKTMDEKQMKIAETNAETEKIKAQAQADTATVWGTHFDKSDSETARHNEVSETVALLDSMSEQHGLMPTLKNVAIMSVLLTGKSINDQITTLAEWLSRDFKKNSNDNGENPSPAKDMHVEVDEKSGEKVFVATVEGEKVKIPLKEDSSHAREGYDASVGVGVPEVPVYYVNSRYNRED